jgi:hypothetical protein
MMTGGTIESNVCSSFPATAGVCISDGSKFIMAGYAKIDTDNGVYGTICLDGPLFLNYDGEKVANICIPTDYLSIGDTLLTSTDTIGSGDGSPLYVSSDDNYKKFWVNGEPNKIDSAGKYKGP